MDGSTFLGVYGVLLIMAFAGAWFVRRHLRVPDDDERGGELHPYEHAYLKGGEGRAIASCIASLQERGAVSVRVAGAAATIAVTTRDDAFEHPLDGAVVRALDTPLSVSFDRALAVRLRALPELAMIRERLERRALLLDDTAARPARLAPAAMMLAFSAVGVARVVHGMQYAKPSAYTLLLAIVGATIALYFASQRVVRSVRGDLVMARITARFREQRATNSVGPYDQVRVERIARLVAIDGTDAVPALAAALAVLTVGTGFNVEGGGGCSDGGGDGGGCGGGGCGGCGGCG
jgi:uncharacterized protein (TIGR04222 family)